MFKKKSYFNFLIFMMMVTTFLPLVANNLPPIIKSFHFYALIFILSIIVFDIGVLLQRNILITLLIGFFTLIAFPLTIWGSIDDWNSIAQRMEFYKILIAILIYYYLITNNYTYDFGRIVNTVIIFIGITSVMTIISSNIDPMYARNLISGGYQDENVTRSFQRLGGGTYGTAIVLMSLFPFLIYFYKKSYLINYSKKTILVFGLLTLIALIRMQIFANILVLVIVLFLSIKGGKKLRRSIIIISIIGFLFLTIPTEIYAGFLI